MTSRSFFAYLLVTTAAFADDTRLDSLSVPEGFEITTAVAPALTAYPMFMEFDDAGRLYIAESTGKDLSGKEMAAMPECQILRLVDTDNDGVFDTRTVFATGLSLPMGVLWHQGALFVASPPDFLRFDDADGDGVAEKRTVLLTGWNVLNTASLHGPFLGPDGWLYLTHGRHGYGIETKEGLVLEGMAARIWRCRPDGTGLERFAGGGFDNPVELIFTDSGQMLGTMTYFTDPRHGQRDALMHWVWGGVYPKPHEVTSEMVQTGPLMPTMTKFARIAPAGFLQYEGFGFRHGYDGNLFSAQFNPHRVQFHKLKESGSTFVTEDSDFLTSTSPDFYPTDILQDEDGSLLVCDTGAWYVDACPISRVAKPEIKGSIYRIRSRFAIADGPRRERVDVTKTSFGDLLFIIGTAPRRLRGRAFQELVARGESALDDLAHYIIEAPTYKAESERQTITRRSAIWAAYQIGGPRAAGAIRAGLNDPLRDVRIAAIQALGLLRDKTSVDAIAARLSSDEPMERREAAAALGRIGDPVATPALLAAANVAADRFEQHAIIYAFIELGDRGSLLAAVTADGSWLARQAALIALDQLHDPALAAEHAVPFLRSDVASARQAALWVAAHHPEWSGTVLAFVDDLLRDPAHVELAASAREILSAYAPTTDGQAFVAARVNDAANSDETRLLLMDVIDGVRASMWPESWREAVAAALRGGEGPIQWRSLEIARKHRVSDLAEPLAAIADDSQAAVTFRIAALSAMTRSGEPLGGDRLQLVLDGFGARDPGTRQAAASILAGAKLDSTFKRALAAHQLAAADALVVTALLQVFTGEADPDLGAAVVDGLDRNPKIADLITAAQLDALLHSFPEAVHARASGLKARLDQRDAGLMERFLRLEPRLGTGDVGRGRAIFFGDTASCSTCHAIGSDGGTLGPDLTTIGLVRSGHDLLEAVMFPSSSMVPEFQPYTIDTGAEVLSGIVERETAEVITLKTAATETRSVIRAGIVSMEPTRISMMPEGLDAGLTDEEVLDLMAFLLSLNNEQWLLPEARE